MELTDLIRRAEALAATGRRRILGITGAPGAGKSTLAQAIVDALGSAHGPRAVYVPMDGFHLANVQLERLGRRDRKGAPDTFDGDGFVHLLRRLHAADEDVVYAPAFRREIEEPIAGAIAVPRAVPLVVTEGNYLLLDDAPWAGVRPLLDDAWFLEPPREVRLERLIARHIAFGKDPEFAREWSLGSDERNAVLVEASRDRADLVIPPPAL